MATKNLKNKPIKDTHTKTKVTSSVIQKNTEGAVSSHVQVEASVDKMSDEEFNKAMDALNTIWRACPSDLPKDLSVKHDNYLFGEKK